MDKKQFEEWYRDNIETMASLGVFHPESSFGKTVHLAIASMQPQINTINDRLKNIERILETDYVPPETKKKLKAPVKKIVMESVELEEKVEEVKKRVERPKGSGWQIGK